MFGTTQGPCYLSGVLRYIYINRCYISLYSKYISIYILYDQECMNMPSPVIRSQKQPDRTQTDHTNTKTTATELLGASGLTTRNKDATNRAPGRTTRSSERSKGPRDSNGAIGRYEFRGSEETRTSTGGYPILLVRHLLLLAWHLFLVASCF